MRYGGGIPGRYGDATTKPKCEAIAKWATHLTGKERLCSRYARVFIKGKGLCNVHAST